MGDGAFDPKGQLARQEAAAILSRLAKTLGMELPAGQPTFADNDAVGQMQHSGIMDGAGDNQFSSALTYSLASSPSSGSMDMLP